MKTQRNQVAVTGIGVFAPNGNSPDAFWESLMEGRSGIGPVTLFDASSFSCRIAGEVKGFDPHDYIDPTLRPKRRMARASQLAIAATYQAVEDAGLETAELKEFGELPVVIGVSTAAMDIRERAPRPWSAVAGIPHAVTSAISFGLGLEARLLTVSNGCASGMDAVAVAAEEIRHGRSDVILTGSADAALTSYVFKCFESSRKMSLRNDAPAKASRPFDRDRDGGVASEAACILVLENMAQALARGARPYAEIISYGSCADLPNSKEGAGLQRAMEKALANAALRKERIDHINAHAPSDTHMDRTEVEMIKNVFGSHAYRIPVTSIKGSTGNPMAVGGVLQIVAAALSMRHDSVPPTCNLDHADPQCDLDHVSGVPRMLPIEHALVNTHGFGRGNSSLIMRNPNA